jgi:hypothetical protein
VTSCSVAYNAGRGQPVAVYLNLGFLGDWSAKAAGVFAAASSAEVPQRLGVPMLGRTFDPLDVVMYAIGVLAAVLA